jgi:hypothetical protein
MRHIENPARSSFDPERFVFRKEIFDEGNIHAKRLRLRENSVNVP